MVNGALPRVMYVVPGVRGIYDRFPLLSTSVQLAPLISFSVMSLIPWSVPVVIVAHPAIRHAASAIPAMHSVMDEISMSLFCVRPVQAPYMQTNSKTDTWILILINLLMEAPGMSGKREFQNCVAETCIVDSTYIRMDTYFNTDLVSGPGQHLNPGFQPVPVRESDPGHSQPLSAGGYWP